MNDDLMTQEIQRLQHDKHEYFVARAASRRARAGHCISMDVDPRSNACNDDAAAQRYRDLVFWLESSDPVTRCLMDELLMNDVVQQHRHAFEQMLA